MTHCEYCYHQGTCKYRNKLETIQEEIKEKYFDNDNELNIDISCQHFTNFPTTLPYYICGIYPTAPF